MSCCVLFKRPAQVRLSQAVRLLAPRIQDPDWPFQGAGVKFLVASRKVNVKYSGWSNLRCKQGDESEFLHCLHLQADCIVHVSLSSDLVHVQLVSNSLTLRWFLPSRLYCSHHRILNRLIPHLEHYCPVPHLLPIQPSTAESPRCH